MQGIDKTKSFQVDVYGLNRRERVHGLIRSLARVPCCPMTIFRIDKFGKLIGVVDHKTLVQYYVRVRRWGRANEEPTIGWTTRPQQWEAGLAARAAKILDAYTSTLRGPVMKIVVDQRSFAERVSRYQGEEELEMLLGEDAIKDLSAS